MLYIYYTHRVSDRRKKPTHQKLKIYIKKRGIFTHKSHFFQNSKKSKRGGFAWDISGFVRLFYISSKNEIISHFPKNIPQSWPIIQGTAGILQLCNTARHNVVIIYVPIYHAFYYLMHI